MDDPTLMNFSTSEMANPFRQGLTSILRELFEEVNGYALDRGTSFFETLATVSAAEASKPVAPGIATIAAQVNHTRFYIDSLLEFLRSGPPAEQVDWAGSWQIEAVSEAEWEELITGLRRAYEELLIVATNFDSWDPQSIGGAFALVAHSAYHLGEVRQGLGVLRSVH